MEQLLDPAPVGRQVDDHHGGERADEERRQVGGVAHAGAKEDDARQREREILPVGAESGETEEQHAHEDAAAACQGEPADPAEGGAGHGHAGVVAREHEGEGKHA